jgi:tetratricopeptide (TPR) repeat protein
MVHGGPASDSPVTVRIADEVIPTYLPATPDKHPMFLENRVYQGSSGRVYPLPCTDRIAETKVNRVWKTIWLENEFLRVMILPELGGRIHAAQDKTNGYDLIYRQTVIKPALVGLAGPWISGGIEFNWPQHHRPATFLPVDFHVEAHADGSKTVWLGDHDPMARMKGMHGVCLHPGKALLEVKVRAYNRTPLVQTFLWWANVATRVHESYQSYFPPDVCCVADHAKRATSEYPLCTGVYYGVDYGRRAVEGVPDDERPANFVPPHCRGSAPVDYAPNDLSWYANIPVPTSYMCMGSRKDFFGGYDHARQAGIVHVANHHISPGKKQWTWGNHEFGYAWDRNLTDADGPYIELMAGVYTDNQPDFSFLQPGETKTWSQYWYPIQKIGVPREANRDAAVSLSTKDGKARIGVAVSAVFPKTTVAVSKGGSTLARFKCDLAPASPLIEEIELPPDVAGADLLVRVLDAVGREIIATSLPSTFGRGARGEGRGQVLPPATEPLPPEAITSTDELYITGLHLEQYRHATRCPTLYWREALRRDPLDSRCNSALGRWHLRRGEFKTAETHFRHAIERLTLRNPNPYDGEPFYNLGLALRHQIDAGQAESGDRLFDNAYAAFYKATWNQAWAAAGYHALAEMDCRRDDWSTALDHLARSLRFDSDNLRARDLKVVVLHKLGRDAEAETFLLETLALDPLDWWARRLAGQPHHGGADIPVCRENGDRLADRNVCPTECDAQVRLDVAHDYARAGLYGEAIAVLEEAETGAAQATSDPPASDRNPLPTQSLGALPLVEYALGWLHERMGDGEASRTCFRRAAVCSPDHCFPARLEEIAVFEAAMRANPNDARAPYYLGNLLYDRRRHDEAVTLWQRSVTLDPDYSVAWRNLGIGYFNCRKQPAKAKAAYERAFRADRTSARLLFERDQLWKRLGLSPAKRLRALEKQLDLVGQRDDLSVELSALYNQTGRYEKSLELISGRTYQPWEGGEGQAMAQHVRSRLALGRRALNSGDAVGALEQFEAAASSPHNLGEAKHLLANQSDIHYWLGRALAELGRKKEARQQWLAAAAFKGDFQEMSVRAFSEMTYYSALALKELGKAAKAKKLLGDLLDYARKLEKSKAKIDYFATSLPTMLLFDDDIQFRRETTALFLQAQARLGLGQKAKARSLLRTVLKRDPNHALAADLLNDSGD